VATGLLLSAKSPLRCEKSLVRNEEVLKDDEEVRNKQRSWKE
jgi:hypothetical protein